MSRGVPVRGDPFSLYNLYPTYKIYLRSKLVYFCLDMDSATVIAKHALILLLVKSESQGVGVKRVNVFGIAFCQDLGRIVDGLFGDPNILTKTVAGPASKRLYQPLGAPYGCGSGGCSYSEGM